MELVMKQKSKKSPNQKVFDSNENLGEIIDLLTKADQSVFDVVAAVQKQRQLTTLVDMVTDGIDLTIYCTKTGQPVSTIPVSQYQMFREIHGKDKAKTIVESSKIQTVAKHWLFTDDKALEQLCRHDPYGYFVYAASRILIPMQDSIVRSMNLPWQYRKDIQTVWNEEKTKCWKHIQHETLETIIHANELMRKYLACFATAKVYHILPFKCSEIPPSHLGKEKSVSDWIEELIASFEAIVKHEIKKSRIKRKLTYSDIVDLHLRYEGHSNFRRQRGHKMSDMDLLLIELDPFVKEATKEKSAFIVFTGKVPEPEPKQQIISGDVTKPFKLKFKTPKKD